MNHETKFSVRSAQRALRFALPVPACDFGASVPVQPSAKTLACHALTLGVSSGISIRGSAAREHRLVQKMRESQR